MPTKLIERFQQLEAEMASAITADDGTAIAALDAELRHLWERLLDTEAGDGGQARSLLGFLLDKIVGDGDSAMHLQARDRILALFDEEQA